MFVDRISALKRELIRKRMKRLKTDRASGRSSGHEETSSAAL